MEFIRSHVAFVGLLFLVGCNGVSGSQSSQDFSSLSGGLLSNSSLAGPVSGSSPVSPVSTLPPSKRVYSTDVLLFVGTGTWSDEVSSLKNILSTNGATFQAVSSAQLNQMTSAQLVKFGMILFPGGSGGTQADGLTAQTHARLRDAVQKAGVGYFGICAGAFIAAAPAPSPGGDVSYGLGVVDGPVLDYYYLENQGTDVAMTLLDYADGSTDDVLWYGGPMTQEIAGGVIARYPDRSPAISQMASGNGFVILSGPHPTATQAMLSSLGVSSSDGLHLDLTWNLISAVLNQAPLPAF